MSLTRRQREYLRYLLQVHTRYNLKIKYRNKINNFDQRASFYSLYLKCLNQKQRESWRRNSEGNGSTLANLNLFECLKELRNVDYIHTCSGWCIRLIKVKSKWFNSGIYLGSQEVWCHWQRRIGLSTLIQLVRSW